MIFVSNRKLLIDYTCVEIDKKKRHFAIGAPRVGWWEPARRMGGGGGGFRINKLFITDMNVS